MVPYERDILRIAKVLMNKHSKEQRIITQKNYCNRSIDDSNRVLTDEQKRSIKNKWKSISFAYDMDTNWSELYTSKTGRYSDIYIPNELHYYFTEYKLINFDYLRAFTDKNYLSLLFHDIKQPEAVVRCINGYYYDGNYNPISKETALSITADCIKGGIVIKPSISSWGGRNISFYKEMMDGIRIEKIFASYGKNFIVQKVLKQHSALAAIHSDSVNTIRMITIYIEGELIPLSACLRMGVGKSQVDNFSQGGIGCGIDKDGRLRSVGYDRNGNKVTEHPSGFHFENCIIPNYDKLVETVRKAALRVPMFGVASWDFAVDENGTPVLIEYNVGGGSIDIHQYNNGPLYGENTAKIMDYVFQNYCFEDTSLQYNYYVFKDHITINNGSKDMSFVWVKDKHHNLPVKRIGSHSFEKSKIKAIYISNNVESIDYCAFYDSKKLRYIKLPKSLKRIGRSAFNGCGNLKNVVLPEGVLEINKYAFKNIDNLKIKIPKSVNYIDDAAFEGCSKLVFSVKKGSYAENYAKIKKINFSYE